MSTKKIMEADNMLLKNSLPLWLIFLASTVVLNKPIKIKMSRKTDGK
ncbi:MAG: hypothetical protein R2777_06515 [Chitinophagales bacterium]